MADSEQQKTHFTDSYTHFDPLSPTAVYNTLYAKYHELWQFESGYYLIKYKSEYGNASHVVFVLPSNPKLVNEAIDDLVKLCNYKKERLYTELHFYKPY
jgi:hypothetical protein